MDTGDILAKVERLVREARATLGHDGSFRLRIVLEMAVHELTTLRAEDADSRSSRPSDDGSP